MPNWKDVSKALDATSPLAKAAWSPTSPEEKAWCTQKVMALVREGKTREQAAAIAYTMGQEKFAKGGAGSGNYHHSGRPGERGGSGPGGGGRSGMPGLGAALSEADRNAPIKFDQMTDSEHRAAAKDHSSKADSATGHEKLYHQSMANAHKEAVKTAPTSASTKAHLAEARRHKAAKPSVRDTPKTPPGHRDPHGPHGGGGPISPGYHDRK